jgi:DNA-binding response OmpR family regulator
MDGLGPVMMAKMNPAPSQIGATPFHRAEVTGACVQILVVDDEPSVLRMLKFSLERLGHEVVAVADADAALAAFDIDRTALVMLDIMMPGMDGLSLCRRWRAEGITVPIIFLTARDEQAAGEYLAAGATDWVQKPCSLRDLLAPIHRFGPAAVGAASAPQA